MRTAQQQAWLDIVDAIAPSFEGRAVAMGDACVAAIHYGDFYEGMGDFSFAVLREDYDALCVRVAYACAERGFTFDASAQVGDVVVEKPYVRVGKACETVKVAEGALAESAESAGVERVNDAPAEIAWVHIYPLDAIPMQSTLRFKIFGEANKVMARYRTMEESGDFAQLPELAREVRDVLQRYNGVQSTYYARLCGYGKSGQMGERTIFQRSIDPNDLFPVRTIAFAGTTLPVGANVTNWASEMTPGRERLVEIIQQESLEALVEVDRVCREIGIDYFLVGGSMLGAIRHEGFIPWDDDTDVGMLRADYDRFCREAPKHLKEGYFVQLPSTDPHIHFVYARLRKPGYEYLTHYNEDKDFHKGIWVDIFPFDARPRSGFLAKLQRKGATVFAKASMALKRRKEYVEHDVLLADPLPTAADERYLRNCHALSRFFPVRLCEFAYHRVARCCNAVYAGKEGTVYASFIPSYTTIGEQEVRPIRRVRYQGEELCIPRGAEAFLERQYGDFMQVPPPHQRYAEHGFKCLRAEDGTIYKV